MTVRIAAYEDAIYHRDAAGRLTVHRAFPMFMAGLVEQAGELVVLGRLDPEPGSSHYPVPAAVDFVPLPHYRSLAHPLGVARAMVGSARAFWRVLGRVDVIWVNGPQPIAVLVVPLALLRRRRVVLGVRQNTIEYGKARYPGRRLPLLAFGLLEAVWRLLARRLSVTAVGPELASLYRRSRRLHQLAVSFVSERDIVPADVLERRDYSGPITLVSVGRLETEKNPLLLADVLRALVDGGGDWRLRIVGEGDLHGELEARLHEFGVADRAEMLGYVPLDRGLFDLYRESHIFLHVSWTEGLPQVLLEAFAARLPVVATEVGGVPVVADGAGLLVPPGDAAAAAAAVRRLVEDRELRERLVEAGVERVRDHTTEAERGRLAAFLSEAG